jgi:hypothetical protein
MLAANNARNKGNPARGLPYRRLRIHRRDPPGRSPLSLQGTLQWTLQTLQETFQRALQRTLQGTLQETLQGTLQGTRQVTIQAPQRTYRGSPVVNGGGGNKDPLRCSLRIGEGPALQMLAANNARNKGNLARGLPYRRLIIPRRDTPDRSPLSLRRGPGPLPADS